MEKSKLKIIFFGTSEFAVPAFKYLIQNGYSIVAVITQPEKPAGRAKITMPSPIKKAALESHVPAFEPHNLRDENFLKQFKHLNPDIVIVASYGKIIPEKYLKIPKYGFLNIHPSLLPKYRGPSPIQMAILNGDKETGVAIMVVDKGIDHGPILVIKNYKLSIGDSYKDAEKKLAELGGELLLETLPDYLDGKLEPKEQDHSQATFTKMLSREDGKINWRNTAKQIHNQIRALNPEPGAWTKWNDKILNIIKAEQGRPLLNQGHSGAVVKFENNIAVTTKKCYLILKQIQLEGGKVMDAQSFVNGHPEFLNSKLE